MKPLGKPSQRLSLPDGFSRSADGRFLIRGARLRSSLERLPSFGWGLDVRTVYASLVVRGRQRGALACPCEMAVVLHPPSNGLCNLPRVAFGTMMRRVLPRERCPLSHLPA